MGFNTTNRAQAQQLVQDFGGGDPEKFNELFGDHEIGAQVGNLTLVSAGQMPDTGRTVMVWEMDREDLGVRYKCTLNQDYSGSIMLDVPSGQCVCPTCFWTQVGLL